MFKLSLNCFFSYIFSSFYFSSAIVSLSLMISVCLFFQLLVAYMYVLPAEPMFIGSFLIEVDLLLIWLVSLICFFTESFGIYPSAE